MGKTLGGRIGNHHVLVVVDKMQIAMVLHAMNAFPFGRHVDLELLQIAVDISDSEFEKLIAFMIHKKFLQVCEQGHAVLTNLGLQMASKIGTDVKGFKN